MSLLFRVEWLGERVENLNGSVAIQTHGLKNFSYGKKKDNAGLYLKDDYKTRDAVGPSL